MSANAEDVGASASQGQAPVEESTEERRYELDPESGAESPPAEDENLEEKTSDDAQDEGKSEFQKRIDELTKNWRTAERGSEDLSRENQILREQLAKQGQTPEGTQRQAQEQGKTEDLKTLADFDYDEDAYTAHVRDWAGNLARTEAQNAVKELQTSQQAQVRRQQHMQREQEFAQSKDDYWQTVQGVPVTDSEREIIETSDVGPELVYFLGKNPEVAQSLVNVPEREMVRRVTMLEMELKNARKGVGQKAVSKAPPPAKKVKATDPGNDASASNPDSDKLSDSEWLKRRQKEVEAHYK